jgi:hypothetical protein
MSIFDDIGGFIGAPLKGIVGGLYDDPAKAADPYMQQIPDQLKKYYGPYVDMGGRLAPELEYEFGGLAHDPSAALAKMGAGYKQSPGYQFQLQEALKGARNQAAAGGMGGTPAAQRYAMQTAQGLAAQDFNQYMQRAMHEQGLGLQGQFGLEQQGFGASTGLADALANVLGSRAQLAYEGAAGRNKMLGGLLSGALGALGGFMGGGK